MNKPQMKTEAQIANIIEDVRLISVFASKDAIDDFKTFGAIRGFETILDRYDIWVDSRFDFDEVVRFIESYSQPASNDWQDLEQLALNNVIVANTLAMYRRGQLSTREQVLITMVQALVQNNADLEARLIDCESNRIG